MMGKLYIVPTPIGNLKDITLRALEVLQSVDWIAAEDTRHTLKLLNHYQIKKKMVSYFEHNKRERGERLVALIKEGNSVALVSDAGMPAISDPGEDLVSLCIEAGIEVDPLPGASAFVVALVGSGLSTGRFLFEGFLPVSKAGKKERMLSLKHDARTIIFYEAPHKLKKTLKDLLEHFGNRRIVLARELSKIHQEFNRTTINDAIESFLVASPKGEYVLVLEGNKEGASVPFYEKPNDEQIASQIDDYMSQGLSKKEALKKMAKEYDLNKRELYKKLIKD
jgi:16S rRNA (cytidine1402-2'-O)-methyltransferase